MCIHRKVLVKFVFWSIRLTHYHAPVLVWKGIRIQTYCGSVSSDNVCISSCLRRARWGCVGRQLWWRCPHWSSGNCISARSTSAGGSCIRLWTKPCHTESSAARSNSVSDRAISYGQFLVRCSHNTRWGLCCSAQVLWGVVHTTQSKGLFSFGFIVVIIVFICVNNSVILVTKTKTKMIVRYNTRIKAKTKGSGKNKNKIKKGYLSLTNKNYKDCMTKIIQNGKAKITKRWKGGP